MIFLRYLLVSSLLLMLKVSADSLISDNTSTTNADEGAPAATQEKRNLRPQRTVAIKEKSAAVTSTKEVDSELLKSASHAHGDHDCEITLNMIFPDFSMRTANADDLKIMAMSLEESSHSDSAFFGNLELIQVSAQGQDVVEGDEPKLKPKTAAASRHNNLRMRRNLQHYWLKDYYATRFYWGYNTASFWTNMGSCSYGCSAEEHSRGYRRNLMLTSADVYAKELYDSLTANPDNEWMQNMVYLHVMGDCGDEVQLDGVYEVEGPQDNSR